jgi:hypothetical protein
MHASSKRCLAAGAVTAMLLFGRSSGQHADADAKRQQVVVVELNAAVGRRTRPHGSTLRETQCRAADAIPDRRSGIVSFLFPPSPVQRVGNAVGWSRGAPTVDRNSRNRCGTVHKKGGGRCSFVALFQP